MPPVMPPTPEVGPNPSVPLPPLGGAPATDADLLALADQIDSGKADLAMKAAPQPEKPYKVRTLNLLRDVLNKVVKIVPDLPPVEWEFVPVDGVGGRDQVNGPIPAPLWVPFFGIAGAIEALAAANPMFSDYLLHPLDALDDVSLADAVNTLDMALKNPEFVKALKEGPNAPEAEEEPKEEPDMTDEYASRAGEF